VTIEAEPDQRSVADHHCDDPDRRRIPTGILTAATACGVLLVAGADDFANGLRLGPWMQAQQQFSYEHEFVRRGLVGELLRQVAYPNTPRPMYLLSAAVYFGVAALTARLAWDALAGLEHRRRQAATVLLVALPFALPHLAFDLGRADTFLYLMVLPLLVWRRTPVLASVAVGGAGVLVHELFLVVQLPLLVGSLVGDGGWRALLQRRVVALGTAAAVAFVAVALAGNLDSMTQSEFRAELQDRVPGYHDTNLGAPHTLLYMTPGSEVRRSLRDLDRWSAVNMAFAAVPAGLLLWAYVRLRRSRRDLARIGVILAPSAVLLLMGHDVTRWVALASFNLLIVLLLRLRDHPLRMTDIDLQALRVPVLLLAMSVLGGPIGTINAYPLWTKVF
jgi:hypothetical protein